MRYGLGIYLYSRYRWLIRLGILTSWLTSEVANWQSVIRGCLCSICSLLLLLWLGDPGFSINWHEAPYNVWQEVLMDWAITSMLHSRHHTLPLTMVTHYIRLLKKTWNWYCHLAGKPTGRHNCASPFWSTSTLADLLYQLNLM